MMMEAALPGHDHDCDQEYDEAGRALLRRLGLDQDSLGPLSELDSANVIYRGPGHGAVWVGDQRAAKTEKLLSKYNITAIVNCTHNIANFFPEKYKYFTFPIGKWRQHYEERNEEKLWSFISEYLGFLDSCLSSGENVLVHCLAGAHRAGTAGVIAVMYLTGLGHVQALEAARRARPAIEPIGSLESLLNIVETLLSQKLQRR